MKQRGGEGASRSTMVDTDAHEASAISVESIAARPISFVFDTDVLCVIMSHMDAYFVATTAAITSSEWASHGRAARLTLQRAAGSIRSWYKRVADNHAAYPKSSCLRDLIHRYPLELFIRYPDFAMKKRSHIRQAMTHFYDTLPPVEVRSRSDVVAFIMHDEFTLDMVLDVGF